VVEGLNRRPIRLDKKQFRTQQDLLTSGKVPKHLTTGGGLGFGGGLEGRGLMKDFK